MSNRELRCYWAGQLLPTITTTVENQSTEIKQLKERLNEGQITHVQHGVSFAPTEMVVDVYEDGKMIALYNLKKGSLVFSFDFNNQTPGNLLESFFSA